ncbi:MAG: hypothetical protein SXA11_04735 [Cyanobacteriota bacterium]|nr:hypothetical protein [Cyanobacteriota bacterium]
MSSSFNDLWYAFAVGNSPEETRIFCYILRVTNKPSPLIRKSKSATVSSLLAFAGKIGQFTQKLSFKGIGTILLKSRLYYVYKILKKDSIFFPNLID